MDLTPAPLFRPPVPAPRTTPPDLFAFLHAARTNPLTSWMDVHFEEPIVMTKGVLGRVMIVNDPAAIRHVFVDNVAAYRKDALQRKVLASGDADGLLTAEGDEWRLQRRTLAPLFTPRTVQGFAPAMAEATARMLRRWRRRDGRVLDVSLEMTRVTLDVLERTIFTQGPAHDPDALGRAITRFFEAVGPIDPLDVFGLPDWLPRLGRLQARPALAYFERLVADLVGARKALIAAGGPVPRDILTLLLEANDPETGRGLSDIAVGANVITFIGAGHETTANALTWALYLLSGAPDVRARLEAEVDAVLGDRPLAPEDIARLPLVRAVLEETMRLFPPVPFMSREAVQDDRVAGYKVPRGTLVVVAPWILHRHRRLWDEADAFDPDRFGPERRERIDRFAYLPFGAGPRVCIGASFALQEAVVVLAEIVRTARLDLAEGHEVKPVHRVTLRPQDGLPMQVRLRRDARPREAIAR
jgi:cytochrome P450